MHTESLTRIFLTFLLMQRDSKRICKRYRLRLLRFRLSCDMLFFAYIYCPKESKCHALARFVLFVRLVFEKTFVYIFKLNTNFPNQTNHFICRLNLEKIRLQSLLSCQGTIKIKRKSKEKIKKRIREKTPYKSVILRERFLI